MRLDEVGKRHFNLVRLPEHHQLHQGLEASRHKGINPQRHQQNTPPCETGPAALPIRSMTSALERLPNELLDQIIFSLTTEPPSSTRLHRPPRRGITQSQTRDLKHLAQTSQHFLDLVRPRLFAHACLDLEDEPEFQSFMVQSGFGRYVTSLVATTGSASADPADQGWWRRVLSYLDPARLTVLAPPTFIGNLLNSQIMDGHSWAFDIPLQVLQVERTCSLPNTSQLPDLKHCDSLLRARAWTSMSFNESSSLRAYNHYEYFLSRVPSVLGEWGTQLAPHRLPPLELSNMLRGLTSFSYTAVFPFYNHVKLVLDALVLMPQLHTLSMQLAPDEDNHITEAEQRGSMDPNDPWMELATSYALIGFEVNRHPSLVEFRSRDFHLEATMPELAHVLEDSLGDSGWVSAERGVWKRLVPRT